MKCEGKMTIFIHNNKYENVTFCLSSIIFLQVIWVAVLAFTSEPAFLPYLNLSILVSGFSIANSTGAYIFFSKSRNTLIKTPVEKLHLTPGVSQYMIKDTDISILPQHSSSSTLPLLRIMTNCSHFLFNILHTICIYAHKSVQLY